MNEDQDVATDREEPWVTAIYGAVVRAMAEGVVVHDATGSIRTANPSAERILGLSLDQMKGLKAVDSRWRLVLSDGRPATSEDIPSEITQRTGAPCRNVTLGVHRSSGELAWLSVNTDLVRDEETGRPWLIVATFNDVTAEVRARKEVIASDRRLRESNTQLQALTQELTDRNQAYESALERAEASNVAKSQFLANMSHELRTPLNAVVGFSDLILNTTQTLTREKLFEYVRDIHKSGLHLLEIVDELLDISRLEIGALDVHLRPAKIGDLIADAMRVSRIRADEKKVAIRVQGDPDAVAALCDQKLVRQALINVLVNAIKFSPVQSEVRIAVEATESTVTIITTDAGPGFTEAGIREAFEPFWQDRSNPLSTGEGVGLGLAIAKRYVEAAGGSITIGNSPQGGARVSIALNRSTNGRPSAPPE